MLVSGLRPARYSSRFRGKLGDLLRLRMQPQTISGVAAMTTSPLADTHRPPQVWVAMIVSLLLGLYAELASVPLCLAGLFVGPHIFVPGLFHAVLGVVLLAGWMGLLRRRPWARWLLLLASAFMVLAIPSWAVWESLQVWRISEDAVFFLPFSALFALITFNLASKRAGAWFKK